MILLLRKEKELCNSHLLALTQVKYAVSLCVANPLLGTSKKKKENSELLKI